MIGSTPPPQVTLELTNLTILEPKEKLEYSTRNVKKIDTHKIKKNINIEE